MTNEHVWERELSSELNDWGMIAFLIRLEHKLGKNLKFLCSQFWQNGLNLLSDNNGMIMKA